MAHIAVDQSDVRINIIQISPGPEVIKLFFMLNSAEHEICLANKSQITSNFKFYFTKQTWAGKFLC